MSKRRVTYYYDPDVGSYTYGYGHLMKPQRMRITHELVSAYDMLSKMHILRAKRASAETMSRFHTDEYVHFLSRVTPETYQELTYNGSRFLVPGDDNPAFEGVFEFCSISAGGSLAAAQRLASGATDIAINWAGGLHHAKKREASGFCYINDIVLAILELLRSVPRVLYIDIDCHHGDGVEEAFYTTDRVMTCSFHKYGDFFPGTGGIEDKGRGSGKGYAVNVPLKDGVTDESFKSVFEPVIDKIVEVFRPSAVVLQCGADSLAGDRLGCFNLTMQGHANCVRYVRAHNLPLILVGGGGYTVKNVARTWAYETACALGMESEIDLNLPWNPYFEWFGPRYRLEVVPNNMTDANVQDGYIDKVRESVLRSLSKLQAAPSVGMHDVPQETLSEHLGFGKDDDNDDTLDVLDEHLAQHSRFVYRLQEANVDESDGYSSEEPSSHRLQNYRMNRRRVHGERRHMSIITNKYFDVPRIEDHSYAHVDLPRHHESRMFGSSLGTGPALQRRFFQSAARWDHQSVQVLTEYDSVITPATNMADVMGMGWRRTQLIASEMDVLDDEGM